MDILTDLALATSSSLDDKRDVIPIRPGKSREAPLWNHQRGAIDFALSRPATLFDIGMGGGKTRITCESFNRDPVGHGLILCPKSVRSTWRRELTTWGCGGRTVVVLDGSTAARKRKQLAEAIARGKPIVCVVNYELARGSLFDELAAIQWAFVVADESQRLKSPDSATNVAVCELAKHSKRRIAMSGTPWPNSGLDSFGQFLFLDSTVFGDDYELFCLEFGVPEDFGRRGVQYRTVRHKKRKQLWSRMEPFTFRVSQEQIAKNLPAQSHIRRYVELTPKARRIYNEVEDGCSKEISTATGEVALLRLTQITGGFATHDDGAVEQICTAKQEALKDIIDGLPRDEPVVVFSRFRAELAAVEETARRAHRPYAELSGSRKELNGEGRMPETPGLVMGVQIQAGGVGVDLTRASKAVYWSTSFSWGEHSQSLARIHRPGQTKPVQYLYLIANNTVDEIVYRCLRRKRDAVAELVGGGA